MISSSEIKIDPQLRYRLDQDSILKNSTGFLAAMNLSTAVCVACMDTSFLNTSARLSVYSCLGGLEKFLAENSSADSLLINNFDKAKKIITRISSGDDLTIEVKVSFYCVDEKDHSYCLKVIYSLEGKVLFYG